MSVSQKNFWWWWDRTVVSQHFRPLGYCDQEVASCIAPKIIYLFMTPNFRTRSYWNRAGWKNWIVATPFQKVIHCGDGGEGYNSWCLSKKMMDAVFWGTFALKENGSSKSSLKQPTLTSSKLLCLYTSLKAFFIGEKVNSLARENLRNKWRLKLNFLIQHFV